ncbi:MAG: phosphodiester glycosidase family protein [Acidaminobacteraceae bacterium]
MIKKFVKIITASFIISSLVLSPFNYIASPAFADYKVLHTTSSSEQMSTGVTYNEKLMFTDIGWVSVKYMLVDLKDPNTYIDVLYNKEDVTVRNKLSKLSTSPELIGAINGDFFDYGAKSTLGTIVSNGDFISTGIHDGKFSSFNVSKLGIPFLQNWTSAGLKLTSESSKLTIEYKNKPYLDFNRAIIYDHNWKDSSYGNTLKKDIVELVIESGLITDIRRNLDPVAIGPNTTVISAVGTKISAVTSNFRIGDKVEIAYDINFNNINTSIGGGSIILENGKVVTNLTLPIPGRHPRTSVGINKDKNKLIYAVVDGRTSSFVGVTESELASIMFKLGANDALNLDGGGSTEMVTKKLGSDKLSIVNTPSDGVERAIFTGLAVFSNSAKGNIEKLDVDISTDAVIGTDIKFTAFNTDENYFRTNLSSDDLKINFASDAFKLKDGNLFSLKEGTHEIEFIYNDQSIKKSIEIKDSIVNLSIKNSSIISDINTSTPLEIDGIDENGFKHKLDLANITFAFSSDKLGKIDENYNFVSSKNIASGYLSISYKGIKKYIPIIVGDNYKIISDFEPSEDLTKKLTFISYPELNKGKMTIHNFGINNSYGALVEYDFTYTSKTRAAYISLGESGYLLDDQSKKLGLSVFGNYGNSHWLRAKLTDANGKQHNVDFALNVNWENWKYVEAIIPDSLARPLKLDRIYLVEDEASELDRGVIMMDRLVQVGTSNIKVDLPKDITKIPNLSSSTLDKSLDYQVNVFTKERSSYNNFDNKINILMGNADNKDNKLFNVNSRPNNYVNTDTSGVKVLNFVNYNNSIRKSGYGQWLDLLRLKESMNSKALVIVLSSGKNFKDSLEENLFYDTIKFIENKYNIPAVVVYPNKISNIEKINSVDVIGLQTNKLESKNFLNEYLSIGFKNGNTSYKLNK